MFLERKFFLDFIGPLTVLKIIAYLSTFYVNTIFYVFLFLFSFLLPQEICSVAAVNIEATSKRIEQAVGNMLEVLKTSYEKVKEGSKPSLKPGETESQELVC